MFDMNVYHKICQPQLNQTYCIHMCKFNLKLIYRLYESIFNEMSIHRLSCVKTIWFIFVMVFKFTEYFFLFITLFLLLPTVMALNFDKIKLLFFFIEIIVYTRTKEKEKTKPK